MTITTSRRGLDRAELLTTTVAFLVSSTLYATQGAPYLARAVVGDLVGFLLLGGVVVLRRRRVRHEALACLASIAMVLTLNPDWPLRQTSAFWWMAVIGGLAAYLGLRRFFLGRRR